MICDVHKNSREVCDHENAPSFPVELHADLDLVIDVGLDAPALYDVLTKLLLSLVDDLLRVHDGQVAVSSLEVKLETAELISKGIKLDVIEPKELDSVDISKEANITTSNLHEPSQQQWKFLA